MKEKVNTVQTLPGRVRRLAGRRLVRTCAGSVLRLGAAFVLAGASAAGRPLPIAVSLTAASASPLRALAAMLGGSLGYLYFWGFTDALESLSVGVLVFAAVCVAGGAEARGFRWLMPLSAAVMSMLVGMLFLVQARFTPAAVVWYLLRIGLTTAGVWVFEDLELRRRRRWALAAAGAFLSGCAAVKLAGGVNLGQVLAVALGTAAVGGGQSLLISAVGGLAVDIAGRPEVSLTALLCCAALASEIPGFRLRPARVVMYLTMVCAGVLFTGGLAPELVAAAALGSCLSLLIPESLTAARREEPPQDLRERLEDAAAVCAGIQSMLERRVVTAEGSAAEIFDRATDQVCGSCALRSHCWKRRGGETYEALLAAARPMLERGAAAAADFPPEFAESCCHFNGLLTAINRQLDEQACRRQCYNRVRESRAVLSGQYAILTGWLRRTAAASGKPGPPEAYAPELGVSSANRRGSAVSGDRGASLRAGGMYYLLLCDGMGSGPEAAAESRAAIDTLTGLLRAGLTPRDALETLNGLYLLRGDGGFATVDLLALSLVSGGGILYKWGAAPSYLKTAAGTQKIGTASPPPGFGVGEAHKAAEYRLSLRGGEVLVLLSDGAGGEDAGQRIAAGADGTPGALAAALVAEDQTNGEDDRTAAVLRLRPCSVLP